MYLRKCQTVDMFKNNLGLKKKKKAENFQLKKPSGSYNPICHNDHEPIR